jgi:DNA mismatch endonuclease, patch repair protein
MAYLVIVRFNSFLRLDIRNLPSHHGLLWFIHLTPQDDPTLGQRSARCPVRNSAESRRETSTRPTIARRRSHPQGSSDAQATFHKRGNVMGSASCRWPAYLDFSRGLNNCTAKCFMLNSGKARKVVARSPSYKGLLPSSEQASRAKQHNQGINTRHEQLLRRELWRRGLRYRKNCRTLPGKPDIVFSKAKLVVFCDGDFWHGRHWAKLSRSLRNGANAPYWIAKIETNRERDRLVAKQLRHLGWQVIRVWETDILKDPRAAAKRIERALNAIR